MAVPTTTPTAAPSAVGVSTESSSLESESRFRSCVQQGAPAMTQGAGRFESVGRCCVCVGPAGVPTLSGLPSAISPTAAVASAAMAATARASSVKVGETAAPRWALRLALVALTVAKEEARLFNQVCGKRPRFRLLVVEDAGTCARSPPTTNGWAAAPLVITDDVLAEVVAETRPSAPCSKDRCLMPSMRAADEAIQAEGSPGPATPPSATAAVPGQVDDFPSAASRGAFGDTAAATKKRRKGASLSSVPTGSIPGKHGQLG
eukprot:CAMPEP_0204111030 /NCGR_PEP_ID=MMETSP0361-20130328/2226_1 /ASSEMBLY_ACC=CAM_ASM_000343 /TAXON_ID=268821 /ORGANISM="Scrippsiella Hangoei, Strain SHTV-5" /LENGTH=261 /DNA_ID=CAMNT_0051061021 /DNA_START=121 /DNA_END=902 /DNA_ORIENTATION=-